jgi:RimJ/RimL family protein N-acetyltransferase
MIHELRPADFEKARPAFGPEMAYNLIVSAVLDGSSPGRVWVDDPAQPRAAFLWGAEGWYLDGAPNAAFAEALNPLIMTEIRRQVLAVGQAEFFLGYESPGWAALEAAIFAGAPSILRNPRRHYVCRALAVDWQALLPAGYEVARIDADLLARPGLDVPEHVHSWMGCNWGGAEAFFARGFGFATLCDHAIVSWSLADCISRGQAEIGIQTRPDYRRRGLATITAAAAVEYALGSGLEAVGWHCNEINRGSIGVAEKVGFALERHYTHHYFYFDPANHLAEQGWIAFRAGDYRETVACYARVFPEWDAERFGPAPDYLYILAGRAWAALGEPGRALEFLNAAVDAGWDDREDARAIPEFAALHGTPGWAALLARLEGESVR